MNPKHITIYMSKGLACPTAMISCDSCGDPFLARLSWESAYKFDSLGCDIIGFSKRAEKQFTGKDIKDFMKDFDYNLEVFLDIIESENDY